MERVGCLWLGRFSAVSQRRKPPNHLLREARRRLPSPSGSGRPMSRQELADGVNAYLASKEKGGDQEEVGETSVKKAKPLPGAFSHLPPS